MKKINALRKLKYILKRHTLLKHYKTFILPVLEYACELWDGMSALECNLLEKAQREAARIITGLPSYASSNSLYFETGLETLSNRRKRRKLQLLYKMKNGLAPDYLEVILPQTVGQNTPYPLRNANNFDIPVYRLSLTNSSFLPSTLRLWNQLDNRVKSSPSFNIFKKSISPDLDKLIPPNYFGFGDRKSNILHTKLRHQNSTLRYDLFRFNLVENPECLCGNPCENSYHYFLECPRFSAQRRLLLTELDKLNLDITNELLLFGNEQLPCDTNFEFFRNVHIFIKTSKRF